ncbi:MAG: EAL domain-containing protein [Gammaproteobacteria bacterium]|nr:EAL domain-containing protein [Gammaproteobacteria bacterium]
MNTELQTAAENGHRQRVLVVDDDSALRQHACAVLRTFGLDVCEAASGEQALELLGRERVDAVLLDIRMPGMDGFETCRRVRALRRGESLPVIVVTGLDDMAAIEGAYHAGATDFVVKPINWTILKHRIRYTLSARMQAEDLVATTGYRQGLLKTIPDAVLSLDRDGRMMDVRLPDARWLAGEGLFPVGELLPDILPKAAAELGKTAIQAIQQGEHQTSFEFAINIEGGERSYEVYLAPGGSGDMVALVRDFTERRRAEAEIRQLAYFDRVTGLPNREMMQKFVDDRLGDGAMFGGSLALLRLELRGLDYARSLLGQQRADELLNMCADRLRQLVDSTGTPGVCACSLVGRVSDAGFAVVLDELSEEGPLQTFAERVHAHMASSYTLGDYEINITARLGIATLNKQPGADAGGMFDHAEMATAQSQSAPALYSSKTGEKRRDRARLMKELQTAVNNGDLHLEYQPKVDSANRILSGVEALARWHHPSRGPVSPGVFIPLAEESGLILPLGEFVLEEASRQSRQWRRADRKVVPIAVNFSGHQFSKKGLLESMIATLDGYSIGEGEVEIELTETVAMDQCAGIGLVLQELHDIGIRTAIDDFGTGHSSLNNLRQFQFHTLKIDRSFVADLDHNPSARSLIRGIIGMGHALGMQVVAEGVEQDQQLDYLREQGCDLIQGYLTGRPMSGECIADMLQTAAA